MSGRALSHRLVASIVRLYDKGCTTREVSEITGCATRTVRKYIHITGAMRPNHRHSLALPPVSKLRSMKRRLGSVAAVADVLGCCRQTVHNRLNGRGR